MSKSVMLTIIIFVMGLCTIAVGLYVLSITPAPIPEPVQSSQSSNLVDLPESLVLVPENAVAGNAAEVPVVRGDEAWCEQMMLITGRWPDADARLFAKNCIYE